MARFAALAYGGLAYALFLASFAWLFFFVGDIGPLPTVDRGPTVPHFEALLRDLGWFVLFGLQHSVMARPWFKKRFTSGAPAIERSHFVLASALMLFVLFHVWSPLPSVVWDVAAAPFRELLFGVYLLGWIVLVVSSFFIDHFAMFGLRQVWDAFRGARSDDRPFATPYLYRCVRHPIYLGFVVLFWAAPRMTVGHLVLATGMTLYIAVGVRFEERELVRQFGQRYREYQTHVPMLIPIPGRAARR